MHLRRIVRNATILTPYIKGMCSVFKWDGDVELSYRNSPLSPVIMMEIAYLALTASIFNTMHSEIK